MRDPGLKDPCDAFQLWEVVRVNQSPIAQLHQLVQAPEDLLLVVRDVKEEETDDVVHALHVAYLVIVVSIGLKYVE